MQCRGATDQKSRLDGGRCDPGPGLEAKPPQTLSETEVARTLACR